MTAAYSAKLLQFGQAVQTGLLTTSGTSVSTTTSTAFINGISISSGNSVSGTLLNQICLRSTISQNAHAINSRHNSAAASDNAIDIFIWQYGTNSISTVGSKPALTVAQTGIGINNLYPSLALDIVGSTRMTGTVTAAFGSITNAAYTATLTVGTILNFSAGGSIGTNLALTGTLTAGSLSATYLTVATVTVGSLAATTASLTNVYNSTLSVGTILNFSAGGSIGTNLTLSGTLNAVVAGLSTVTCGSFSTTFLNAATLSAGTYLNVVFNQSISSSGTTSSTYSTGTLTVMGGASFLGTITVSGLGINQSSPVFPLDLTGSARITATLSVGSITSGCVTGTVASFQAFSTGNRYVVGLQGGVNYAAWSNLSSGYTGTPNASGNTIGYNGGTLSYAYNYYSSYYGPYFPGGLANATYVYQTELFTGFLYCPYSEALTFSLSINGGESGTMYVANTNIGNGATMNLASGFVPIRIEYYGSGGGHGMSAYWNGSLTTGTVTSYIGGAYLYTVGGSVSGSGAFGSVTNTVAIFPAGTTNSGTVSFIEAFDNSVFGSMSAKRPIVLNAVYGGNVGINTSSPAYQLDVTGNAHVSSSLMIGTAVDNVCMTCDAMSSQGYRLGIVKQAGYLPKITAATTTAIIMGISSGTDITQNISTSTITESFRVHSNGYVGINNTSPSYPLDVAGNMRVAGTGNIGTLTVGSFSNCSFRPKIYSSWITTGSLAGATNSIALSGGVQYWTGDATGNPSATGVGLTYTWTVAGTSYAVSRLTANTANVHTTWPAIGWATTLTAGTYTWAAIPGSNISGTDPNDYAFVSVIEWA